MRTIKRFSLWFLPLAGLISPVVNSDWNDTDWRLFYEALLLSVAVGGVVGMLMGTIVAVADRDAELGIWSLAGSFLGCVLFSLGLFGLITVLGLTINVLLNGLYLVGIRISIGSDGDAPPAAAEALAEVLFLWFYTPVLIPAAIVGGVIGAQRYHNRRQGKE